ncbi:hypothetical protein ScPMuIL_004011 [Solemya velum]
MGLWSYFHQSEGYFESVTAGEIHVQLLDDSRKIRHHHKPSGPGRDMANAPLFISTSGPPGNFTNISFTNGSDLNSFGALGHVSSGFHVVLILLYSFTTVTAILGNVTAITIFAKGKRSKTDLRPFLINLAIADLIMAIFCIPFTFTYQILEEWVFSRPMCPIVLFLQMVSVTASVSTNMAIGIDRFYAVAFPLRLRITTSRYRLIIGIIWLITLGLASAQFSLGRAELTADNILECGEKFENEVLQRVYTMFVLFLTYITPLAILTITYSIVGRILWRRTTPGNADAVRDQLQLKSKRKVVKMLVTVVTLFGLCWLPLHTFILVLDFNPDIEKNESLGDILSYTYYGVHWVAMSNSFVNPIIYGFMNESFRIDLKHFIFRLCPRCHSSHAHRHGAVKRKARPQTQDENLEQVTNTEYSKIDKRLLTPRLQPYHNQNGNLLRYPPPDRVS